MACYADVDFTIQLMSTKQTDDADLRSEVLRALRTVSRRVDNFFPLRSGLRRPYFDPYNEQRAYPVRDSDVNGTYGTLDFSDPLLSTSAVTKGKIAGQSALVVGTDVELYPPFGTPYTSLRLLSTDLSWYANTCTADTSTSPQYVYINGIWGWHSDYAQAWQQVDTLGAAIVSASASTITVSDAAGADEQGFTPRFSPGMLIKIDSEYLEIIDTGVYDTPATNVLTVRRGVNGTTGAEHSNGAAVSVWRIDDDLRRAVARQAGLLFARRGAYTTLEVTAAGSEIRYPQDLLTELRAELQALMYVT